MNHGVSATWRFQLPNAQAAVRFAVLIIRQLAVSGTFRIPIGITTDCCNSTTGLSGTLLAISSLHNVLELAWSVGLASSDKVHRLKSFWAGSRNTQWWEFRCSSGKSILGITNEPLFLLTTYQFGAIILITGEDTGHHCAVKHLNLGMSKPWTSTCPSPTQTTLLWWRCIQLWTRLPMMRVGVWDNWIFSSPCAQITAPLAPQNHQQHA